MYYFFYLNCQNLTTNFDNINVLFASLTFKFHIITFYETIKILKLYPVKNFLQCVTTMPVMILLHLLKRN